MSKYFELPDSECVRLTKPEMMSVLWMLTAVGTLDHALESNAKQLNIVPDGMERCKNLSEQLNCLVQDVIGVVSDKQRSQLRNTVKDMDIRLVPKLKTTSADNVLFSSRVAKDLIDAAQTKCVDCFDTEEESRNCSLRKILEAAIPLDRYSELSCPYTKVDWE